MASERITLTKSAAAYIELDGDTPVSVRVDFISSVVAVNEKAGIGAAILFLHNGKTINVVERVSQIKKMIWKKKMPSW